MKSEPDPSGAKGKSSQRGDGSEKRLVQENKEIKAAGEKGCAKEDHPWNRRWYFFLERHTCEKEKPHRIEEVVAASSAPCLESLWADLILESMSSESPQKYACSNE